MKRSCRFRTICSAAIGLMSLGSAAAHAQQPKETLNWVHAMKSKETAAGFNAEIMPKELAEQMGIAAKGVLITDVEEGSIADMAGLKKYDVITMIADSSLERPEDLLKYMIGGKIDSKTFKLRRAGKEETVVWDSAAQAGDIKKLSAWLTEASQPYVRYFPTTQVVPVHAFETGYFGPLVWMAQEKRYMLGVVLAPVDDVLRAQFGLDADQGLVLSQVSEGGPAERAGCEKNDLLLELDSQKITTEESLREQLQKIGDKDVSLKVIRKGKVIEATIRPRFVDLTPSVERQIVEGRAFLDSIRTPILGKYFRAEPPTTVESKQTKEDLLIEIRGILKQVESKLDELSK